MLRVGKILRILQIDKIAFIFQCISEENIPRRTKVTTELLHFVAKKGALYCNSQCNNNLHRNVVLLCSGRRVKKHCFHEWGRKKSRVAKATSGF
jgi:hypothetical protein